MVQLNGTMQDNVELMRLHTMYEQVMIQEELFLKEKVGYKWVLDDDRNTSYCHEKVNARRRQSFKKLLLYDDINI